MLVRLFSLFLLSMALLLTPASATSPAPAPTTAAPAATAPVATAPAVTASNPPAAVVPPPATGASAALTVAEGTTGNTSDAQRYAIQVKASNTRLQLRVNDIPVIFKILRNNDTVDISFNEWLRKGLNVIDIQMDRFSDQQPYNVSYSVYFQSPTQIVSGEKRILSSSPEQTSLPLRQSIGVRAQSVPKMRIWQAESVDLSPDERDRLLGTLNDMRQRLIDALGKGDNAFLATFDKSLRDEVQIAYGRVPEGDRETLKRRLDIAAQLNKLVNAEVASSPVLALDDVNFEVIANGHLVRITRLDGGPVIKVTRGDLSFTLSKPIYGTIGGLWSLMRND